jgi:hypothetical protein
LGLIAVVQIGQRAFIRAGGETLKKRFVRRLSCSPTVSGVAVSGAAHRYVRRRALFGSQRLIPRTAEA